MSETSKPAPRQCSILVIEDNANLQGMVRLLLETEGFQVIGAGNGEEGIQAFRQQHPDMVLCDVFMPGKDGLEVIRELRRAFPDVKIVAMSGGYAGMVDMLPTALLLGAQACLYKPFSPAEVLETVQRVLGQDRNPS